MIILRNKTFSKKEKKDKKESMKDKFTRLVSKGKEIQEEKRKNIRFNPYIINSFDDPFIHQQHLQDHMTAVNIHNDFAHQAHMTTMGFM